MMLTKRTACYLKKKEEPNATNAKVEKSQPSLDNENQSKQTIVTRMQGSHLKQMNRNVSQRLALAAAPLSNEAARRPDNCSKMTISRARNLREPDAKSLTQPVSKCSGAIIA